MKRKGGVNIRNFFFFSFVVLFLTSCSFFKSLLPKSYRASLLLKEGVEFSMKGRWDVALEMFLKAEKIFPDAHIYNDIGIAYLHVGDMEKAFYYLQKASEKAPDNLYYLLNLAVAYDMAKRYGLALELYDKILKIKPDWEVALLNKAYTLSNIKKINEAISIYKKILSHDPDNVYALSSLGGLKARLGKFDEALDIFRKIVAKGDFPEIYLAMGAIYDLKHQPDKASIYYSEAIREAPDFSLAYFLYGDLKIREGDIKEGVRYLQKSLEVAEKMYHSPQYLGGNYFVLAAMKESLGYDKEAEKYYMKAFSLYPLLKERPRPIDVDAMIELAIFLKDSNKLDIAEKKVMEVLKIDPRNPLAYSILGDIYYLKGEMGNIRKRQDYYDKAIKSYLKSLDLDPQQPEVYVKLGNIYFSQGNLEVVYYRQGKYHQAFLNFKKALDLDPANPFAHLSLGMLYLAQGDYAEADTTVSRTDYYRRAITELTIAASNELGNFYVYYLLALAYRKMGGEKNLKVAEYFVRKSIKMNPEWNSPRYLLASIMEEMNRKEEAEKTLASIKAGGEIGEEDILSYILILTQRGGGKG